MDTKCRHSYENIFMAWFEKKFVFPPSDKLKRFLSAFNRRGLSNLEWY